MIRMEHGFVMPARWKLWRDFKKSHKQIIMIFKRKNGTEFEIDDVAALAIVYIIATVLAMIFTS